MFVPIDAEVLIEELYNTYGYSVSINYIEMNPCATVDDFHEWLHRIVEYDD